jgi:ketol-acid reductoisomerase
MERDDQQLARNGAREIGEYVSLLYEEFRKAGLPKKVARELAVHQWKTVQMEIRTEPLTAMMEHLSKTLPGLISE